jgi:hypothetical protein
MSPENALSLAGKVSREISGCQNLIDQLAGPETATTMAGLKSAVAVLARSMLRTNRVLLDVIRSETVAPAGCKAFDSFADIFKSK